jgi:sterol desaturase/sphingolipid hydroxylase (fatty acid hydroxylase superfamily)
LGEKLEDRYIAFILFSVWIQNVFTGFIFSLPFWFFIVQEGSLAYAIENALDFQFVMNAVQGYIDKIPVFIELPYFVALIISHVLMSLVAYLWHRLAHESRFLWLLSHRPHHISTTLCSATVLEADPRFPFGFIWKMLMFGFVGGVISHLVSGEFYFIELAMLGMVGGFLEIHNHVSAYYEDIRKNKPLMFVMHALGGQGPYHYLHHSSDPDETVVNIGGGYFLLWDRIFGTYKKPPIKKPKIGLTNQPELYFNPFNVALSGLLQIVYELRNNSLRYWLAIIFGGIYYSPPKTKKYLFKKK